MMSELPSVLQYHSLEHTRDDVVPAAEHLAALEGVNGEELLLLLTAAWYHDLGFVEQWEDHEEVSVRISAEVLPGMDYSPQQIQQIQAIILATKIPASPTNHLEEIMVDADLDLLGREDFWFLNQALRIERAGTGAPANDVEWFGNQLAFIQEHRYFTVNARILREAGKQRNIAELATRLADVQLLEKQVATQVNQPPSQHSYPEIGHAK
jgi:uncharacterized protein